MLAKGLREGALKKRSNHQPEVVVMLADGQWPTREFLKISTGGGNDGSHQKQLSCYLMAYKRGKKYHQLEVAMVAAARGGGASQWPTREWKKKKKEKQSTGGGIYGSHMKSPLVGHCHFSTAS